MADETSPTQASLGVELPVYSPSVQIWFAQLDAIFQVRHITTQQTKFAYVLEKIPAEVASEVFDILLRPPTDKPYDILKDALLSQTGRSEEKKLRELLRDVTLGNKQPSQLLRRMQTILGAHKMSDAVLKQLWINKLDADTTQILVVLPDDVDLEKLAAIADRISDTKPIHRISSVQSAEPTTTSTERQISLLTAEIKKLHTRLHHMQKRQSRSFDSNRTNAFRPRRSSSRHTKNRHTDVCWYHEVFGAKARHCRQPCLFNSASKAIQSGKFSLVSIKDVGYWAWHIKSSFLHPGFE